MHCEQNKCNYKPFISPRYNWFYDIEKTHIECEFVELKITAEHADSHLFGTN
jgi:hypothetical protein